MLLRLFRRDDRGAELVEFALVSIVFIVIVFGTLEFGLMVSDYNIVANAAKDGSRYASVRGAATSSPATADDIANYVQTRAMGMTVTVTTTWNPNNNSGSTVAVHVQGTFSSVIGILPQSTVTLSSTSQMLIIR
jgi:Flp pilus assembly protein TadG